MAAGGAPIESPFELREGTAQATSCGPGDTFCRRAINSDYETRLYSDPCALQTFASDQEKYSNYNLWLAPYEKKPCESSGYINCGDQTSRFGPRKVTQESFLQGRGQVTASKRCFASGLKFLPKSEFEDVPQKKCHDMTLYSQNTKVRKSCGSVSEVDMTVRLRPLPGEYAGSFAPSILNRRTLVPNVTAEYLYGDSSRNDRKPVTLSTKKYPSWAELKQKADVYK